MNNMQLACNVRIDIENLENNEIQTINDHNMVVTAGKNLVRDLLGKVVGVTGLDYIAIGTNSTTVALTDIKLGTENYRDVFTSSIYTPTTLTIKYYLSSVSSNGVTLTEAGLFGDNTTPSVDSGTLFARVVHAGIAKSTSVAITYTWEISIN